jgi:hypothetical protein
VKDTLNAITKLVLLNLTKKYGATAPAAESQRARVPVAASPVHAPAAAEMVAASGGGAPPTADVPSAAVTVGSEADLPPEAPAPKFGEAEIDELVGEVQTADVTIADTPTDLDMAPPPVDDADGSDDAVAIEIDEEEDSGETLSADEAEVTLTEAASDDDLFEDPNLEVARLAAGEIREIIVPVEVGNAETGVRRYKLGLKLRLDPVD